MGSLRGRREISLGICSGRKVRNKGGGWRVLGMIEGKLWEYGKNCGGVWGKIIRYGKNCKI